MIKNSAKGMVAVEQGAHYRRTNGGEMVEIAEVIEIGRDPMGIAHVRFKVHLMRGGSATAAEQRTLALESFSARYKEKVARG